MPSSPSLWRTLAALGRMLHRCVKHVLAISQLAASRTHELHRCGAYEFGTGCAGSGRAPAIAEHHAAKQVWQPRASRQPAHPVRCRCNHALVAAHVQMTSGRRSLVSPWQVLTDRRRALRQAAAVPGERGDLVPQPLRAALRGARSAPRSACLGATCLRCPQQGCFRSSPPLHVAEAAMHVFVQPRSSPSPT